MLPIRARSKRRLAAMSATERASFAQTYEATRLEAGGVGATLTTLQKVATALDLKVTAELSTASRAEPPPRRLAPPLFSVNGGFPSHVGCTPPRSSTTTPRSRGTCCRCWPRESGGSSPSHRDRLVSRRPCIRTSGSCASPPPSCHRRGADVAPRRQPRSGSLRSLERFQESDGPTLRVACGLECLDRCRTRLLQRGGVLGDRVLDGTGDAAA